MAEIERIVYMQAYISLDPTYCSALGISGAALESDFKTKDSQNNPLCRYKYKNLYL